MINDIVSKTFFYSLRTRFVRKKSSRDILIEKYLRPIVRSIMSIKTDIRGIRASELFLSCREKEISRDKSSVVIILQHEESLGFELVERLQVDGILCKCCSIKFVKAFFN